MQVGLPHDSLNNLGISVQLVLSTAAGQSLVGMWMMVNSLQILRFMPMMRLYLSRSIFMFISQLTFLSMQNEALQSIFLLHIDEENLEHQEVSDYKMVNLGIESKSILMSDADVFMFVIVFFIYFAILFVLSKIVKPYDHDNSKVAVKNANSSKYSTGK